MNICAYKCMNIINMYICKLNILKTIEKRKAWLASEKANPYWHQRAQAWQVFIDAWEPLDFMTHEA